MTKAAFIICLFEVLAQFALGGGPELPDFSGALIVLVLVLLAIGCLIAAYFTK